MKKLIAVLLMLCTILFIVNSLMVQGNPGMSPNWLPIYIRSDGSIDPPIPPIRNAGGNQYILTDDLPAVGSTYSFYNIVIEKNDVVLDGANYSIDGLALGWGIDITSRNNVTVKNITISKFSGGVLIMNSSDVNIANCSIVSNGSGIRVQNCSNIHITKNNLAENYAAVVDLAYTNNTLVYGNDMPWHGRTDFYSREGIYLAHSSNNYIVANNIINHSSGIHTFNSSSNHFYQNNLIDNQIQVKEELYGRNWWSILNETAKHLNQGFDFLYFSINSWDNGSIGNYWSNYTSTDSNKDGIGDIPFTINNENSDNYPIVSPVDISIKPIISDLIVPIQPNVPTTKGAPIEISQYLPAILASVIVTVIVLATVGILYKRRNKVSKPI